MCNASTELNEEPQRTHVHLPLLTDEVSLAATQNFSALATDTHHQPFSTTHVTTARFTRGIGRGRKFVFLLLYNSLHRISSLALDHLVEVDACTRGYQNKQSFSHFHRTAGTTKHKRTNAPFFAGGALASHSLMSCASCDGSLPTKPTMRRSRSQAAGLSLACAPF